MTLTTEHRDKVAVITGGGRGFGLAFGQALAARGARVTLIDRDEAAGGQAAEAIRAAGGRADALTCDVTDEIAVGQAMASAAAALGGIDILINNAGLHSAAYNDSAAAMGVDKLRRLFDVNVMGVLICTLAAHPHMKGRAGASVVNISSTAAYGSQTAYGVSKLAVQGLTMMSAHEMGPDGIRVNAIAPGLIFTDTIRAELPETTVKLVLGQQIVGREGEERDVVEAMLHLVSDRAAFMTGETLRVGGGFALQV